MRIAFFILLFTNLVLLLWQTQINQPRADNLPTVPPERRLVLLQETQPQKPAAASAQTHEPLQIPDIELEEELQPAVQPETLSCYTIGPFNELDRARAVVERIRQLGAQVARRSKIEQEQFGYRVFLPPYRTREAAVAATQELAQNGILDYFIISDDDQKNGISLGLFRKKSGATRRIAQVKRFGFNPQMEIRYRDTTIYWLDYEQKGQQVSESIWREITEETPNLQQISRDCPT